MVDANLKVIPKDALVINLWVFRATGLWIADLEGIPRLLYKIYSCTILSIMMGMYFVAEIIYVTYIWNDLRELIDISFVLLTHVGQTVKVINFLLRRNRVEKLLVNSCQTLFEPRDGKHEAIVRSANRTTNRNNVVYLGVCLSICFAWAIIPLMDRNETRRLPLKAWFPFDATRSPFYEIAYVYLIAPVTMNACLNCTMDTLISGLLAIAGAQVDILSYDLANLGRGYSDDSRSKNIDENLGVTSRTSMELKKIPKDLLLPNEIHISQKSLLDTINHHKSIVEFATEIRDTLGIAILGQFAVSSIIICLSCFELSVMSPRTLSFYSMILYQFCMISEIYWYCWYGNGLIVKTLELSRAAFASNWIAMPPKMKTSLKILMCRMQRPVRLVVGGIFVLSLETFIMILRTAYSFYAVLQRIHSQGY